MFNHKHSGFSSNDRQLSNENVRGRLRLLAVSLCATAMLSSAASYASVSENATSASPKAIVIRDSPSNTLGFTFKPSKSTYKKDEAIRFTAKADQDFYLYVYNQGANGSATLIYPNKKEPGELLKKGITHSLPKKVEFAADGSLPTERLVVIATTKKMDVSSAQMKSQGDFLAGDEATLVSGMEAKGIVIRDRPATPSSTQATVVRTLSLTITK